MRKQKLTPEQYKRANMVLMTSLTIVYVIFMLVEMNAIYNGGMQTANYLRIGIYLLTAVLVNIFVRVKIDKKASMLFMAFTFLADYAVLVFGNGPGAMAMMFPVLAVFMIYLNAPLIVIGSAGSFIICFIRAAMLKMAGDQTTFSHANLIMMGIIICFFGARRAINLIITFSHEDKKIIEDKAESQTQVTCVVSEITDRLNEHFQSVVAQLKDINEGVESANEAMDNIAGSTESTSEAVSSQADMTEQIQLRLERNSATANSAKQITGELRQTITDGKKLANELQEQSMLVDKNTTRISDTVEELVKNVEKVSSISASILNISSQTNLLALNASIEAARAGEAGRGFAVVAEEIRKLAEETRTSTEQITDIINQLIAVTNETKEGIYESAESIHVQREKVEQVNTSFSQMETGMEQLHTGVDSISEELGQVFQANKTIVDSISLLSASSEEVSAGAQTSKETLDNVNSSLKGFSEMIEGTFRQLQELKKTVEG